MLPAHWNSNWMYLYRVIFLLVPPRKVLSMELVPPNGKKITRFTKDSKVYFSGKLLQYIAQMLINPLLEEMSLFIRWPLQTILQVWDWSIYAPPELNIPIIKSDSWRTAHYLINSLKKTLNHVKGPIRFMRFMIWVMGSLRLLGSHR